MAGRVLGIICEYNPFHAGHARLLAQKGEGDIVVCLMSGYFTQRGEAAILPPAYRAKAALLSGADLLLELPFPYSSASARYFATAGVEALSRVGVDTLLFGSECGDLDLLRRLAARILEKDYEREFALAARREGAAIAHAKLLGEPLLSNDLLAVEYLRAAATLGTPMAAATLSREGSAYTDERLSLSKYPSAAAIRKALLACEDVFPYLPAVTREAFTDAFGKGLAPADTARLGNAMLARLRAATGADFSGVAECGGGLGAHLVRAAGKAADYEGLCRAAATKQYTDARIRRALLFFLLGVTRADLVAPVSYLRLLGATSRGREHLARMRKVSSLPVVTKASEIRALGKSAERARRLEEVATSLYALTLPQKTLPRDLMAPPVFL